MLKGKPAYEGAACGARAISRRQYGRRNPTAGEIGLGFAHVCLASGLHTRLFYDNVPICQPKRCFFSSVKKIRQAALGPKNER
jgi:hypothetical protein